MSVGSILHVGTTTRRAVRPVNLALTLAIIECFAAEGVEVNALGLQQILLTESVPTNLEALRLAKPALTPLSPEKIDALRARLAVIPFDIFGRDV